MIALIIIGSIISIIILLLSFSLTIYVYITDEVKLFVGAFGYQYEINLDEEEEPKKKKAKKHKKKIVKKKKGQGKGKKKKVDEKTFGDTVELVFNIIKSILKPTAKLLSHIRITKLSLYMTVCSEDADETAIKYGSISAGIYTLLGQLDNLFTLKVKLIDIIPDFVSDEAVYNIYFKVKLRFFYIISTGISMIFKFLVNTIKNKKDNVPPKHVKRS